MSESLLPAAFERSPITVSAPDPLRLMESLVVTLASLTGGAEHRDGEADADAASIATFQAEATAIPELARGIVDDVLATIADSPTEVAEIELANLLRTDDGWRVWGYVRFGEVPRREAPPRIVVEPSDAAADRSIAVLLRVTPAPSAPAPVNGSSSGASDGTSG